MEPFDFAAPTSLPERAVTGLRDTLEPAAVRCAMLLASMLRVPCTAALGELRRVSVDELVRTDGPTGVFAVSTGGAPAVAAAKANVVVELADVVMGDPGLLAERGPTPLESRLVAARIGAGLVPLADALAPIGVTGLSLTPIEADAVSGDDALLAIPIELNLGDVSAVLTFGFPAELFAGVDATHEPVGPADQALPAATTEVTDALGAVPLPVAIRFDPIRIPATEVELLDVGDVIRLEHPMGRPVLGLVGDQPWFLARPGRHGRHLAVQIEHLLETQP